MNTLKRSFLFLGKVRDEVSQIEWTSSAELALKVKVCLSSIVFFGLSVYVMDIFLKSVVDSITQLIRYFL